MEDCVGDAVETCVARVPAGIVTIGSERRPGWTTGGIRLLAALLVGFQVAQGLADPIPVGNQRYTDSYYLVTYGHGFVRRGLLGEVIRLAVGVPTRLEIDAVADLVVILAIAAVLVMIELLVRLRTAEAYAMALLLAASPFTIDFFVVDRRPDLLAMVLLVALGVVLVRTTRRRRAGLLGIGVGLAAMVLVHEAVILIEVPWALVLVALASFSAEPGDLRGDQRKRRSPLFIDLAAVAVPPVVAALAVLAYGSPSVAKAAALRSGVSGWNLTGNTVFTFLPDSIGTSMRLVGAIPLYGKVGTLLLGLVLLGLQLIWMRSWVRPRLTDAFMARDRRRIGVGLAVIVTVATVILFATGFDWLRWIADCGAAWLIVQGFAPLLALRRHQEGDRKAGPAHSTDPSDRIHLSPWLVVLAVYLAAIPPLDILYITDQLRHFLLFV